MNRQADGLARTLSPGRWTLLLAVVLGLVIGVLALGQVVAGARADAESAGIGQADRDSVTREAHTFWDNPFQRLAFRAYGVTAGAGTGPDGCGGRTDGPMFEVTAYTLFGIPLDSITCRAPCATPVGG